MTNKSSTSIVMNDMNIAAQVARFVDRLASDNLDANLKQDIQNFGPTKLQTFLNVLIKRTEELTIQLNQSFDKKQNLSKDFNEDFDENKAFEFFEKHSNFEVSKSTQDFLKMQCQMLEPISSANAEEKTISKPSSNLIADFDQQIQSQVQMNKPKTRKR